MRATKDMLFLQPVTLVACDRRQQTSVVHTCGPRTRGDSPLPLQRAPHLTILGQVSDAVFPRAGRVSGMERDHWEQYACRYLSVCQSDILLLFGNCYWDSRIESEFWALPSST